tara:strand:+ start:689 stop:871 length:183 start_codon:yes stop_codon:yes gene_type:complete
MTDPRTLIQVTDDFDVYCYRGNYYYRNTLPSQAFNRTKDGYNLFKVVAGEHILIPIGDEI